MTSYVRELLREEDGLEKIGEGTHVRIRYWKT